ncbi:MAG TPA: adenylate/guanylate cyclase domain-containing protein [Spirochaetota bacterium]|nr:adenylate/guanylate cyclase domain-containing protein [Spirochaetota bacterium]
MSIFSRNKTNLPGIREVYFGIRIRYLLILSFVMIAIISVLTFIMYINQRGLLEDEKNTKAMALTHILTGPAEFYLDKTIKTTDQELNLKYETITTEAINYQSYNRDIYKIILTDEKGAVKFSTDETDYKRKKVYPYVEDCLEQEEEKLLLYDYAVIPGKPLTAPANVKEKKNKKETVIEEEIIEEIDTATSTSLLNIFKKKDTIEKKRYRAIVYPIFLHKGNVVQLLRDYREYYKKFHEAEPKERDKIYSYMWETYKDILGKDFDPRKQPKDKSISKKVIKAGDIDFVFLKLFGNIMILRDRRVDQSQRWMFRDKWLVQQKTLKTKAYVQDMPQKAKEINDKILATMDTIAGHIENIKKLGSLAIIFNTDLIRTELDQTIYRMLIIAAVMILLGLFLYRFVLNFMIKNLKKLERWALSVSAGNLDSKIQIKTNDEIGRFGDIFNKMIDEITIKYHLEKFVSSSARSMIGKSSDMSSNVELGSTERKNMVFLFSDIRGFTSFSEKNSPETVIEILNFYLNLQTETILSKKGDIDAYVGDEIMAVFKGPNKVERAVESAIDIVKSIKKANMERLKEGHAIFEVGIGINSGDVVIGNIGSSMRMNHTAIGDTVNLASRLCSHAAAEEILVTRDTLEKSKRKFTTEAVNPINVKGKEKPIIIEKVVIE